MMTFEEWFEKDGFKFAISPHTLAMAAWHAAKEDLDRKQPVWIVEPYENECVTYPFWHVVGKDGFLFESGFGKEACVEWAIENGYRIEK